MIPVINENCVKYWLSWIISCWKSAITSKLLFNVYQMHLFIYLSILQNRIYSKSVSIWAAFYYMHDMKSVCIEVLHCVKLADSTAHRQSKTKFILINTAIRVQGDFWGFPLWRSFSRMRISLAVNTSARSMAVYNEAMGWKWNMQQNNLKRLLFYKYNKSCR